MRAPRDLRLTTMAAAIRDGLDFVSGEAPRCEIRTRPMARVMAVSVLSLFFAAGSAYADCGSLIGTSSTWSKSANGLWGEALSWSSGIPSSGATNACVLDGSSTVTLDGGYSIASLQLNSGNALNIGPNTFLGIYGPYAINGGQIAVIAGSGYNAVVGIGNNVALSGGGTVTLGTSGSGAAVVQQQSGGLTLTNLDNLIQGAGYFGNNGLSFVNGATVNANVSGQALYLNGGGGVTNTGLLEATGSGVLVIQNNVVNTGAHITADGGAVTISNSIGGGTLTTKNGGTMGTAGVATLDNVTLAAGSTYGTGPNTATLLSTGLVNHGTFTVTGGGGYNSILGLNNNVVLNGGGTLTLASGSGAAIIQQQAGGLTLTNVDNLIQGAGYIGNNGLSFVNGATVNANVSGQALYLNGGGGMANTGLLEATGGGVLVIQNNVVNTGAHITADGGAVTISNSIGGGTLTTKNGGTMGTAGVATLDNVTLAAGSTYGTGPNTATLLSTGLVNHGTFTVTGGGGYNSLLGLNTDLALSGGGTVTLAGGSGAAIIQQQVGGVTLTNVDNLIQGAGYIGNGGLTFANAATVSANLSGQTLTLNGSGGITNSGLLLATGGGILAIQSNVANTGALITADGGAVTISNAIGGGTLTTKNGGTMGTAGLATLNNVTLSAGSTYSTGPNNNVFVSTGLKNLGNFNVTGGGGYNSVLGLNNNVVLNGGGTLTLASGSGAAVIQQQVGGVTLTNIDNLIQGAGVIGNGGLALLNQATVNANANGQALYLNGSGGITNTGLLTATGGGTMVLQSTGVANSGGSIVADAGSVWVYNASITGGTLTTKNGGSMATVGAATLDSVTLSAGSTYSTGPNNNVYLTTALTNGGDFQVTGGSGYNAVLGLNNSVALSGGGKLTLASGSGAAVIQQQVGGVTLTNVDNLIQGAGVIGNGGLALLNQATVNADANGQALYLNGSGGITNTGLLTATGGGTMVLQSTGVANSGGKIVADAGSVWVYNASITGGTLTTKNGGSMVTVGAATLDSVTLSAGSTYSTGPNNNVYLTTALTNRGDFQVVGGSGYNTVLGLNNSVALNGGGKFTLGSGSGSAYVLQLSGGLTLTNVDNTIQGAGIIGNGGLALTNLAGGTILANAPGQTLVVNGSGGIANAGTVQVVAGSALNIATSFSQTGGRTRINGTMSLTSGEAVSGGVVLGTGAIIGDVALSGGAMQPGELGSPGMLSINGKYTQGAFGAFNVGLSGASFGQLVVSGSATLAGTIDAMCMGICDYAAGTKWEVMTTSGGLTGVFAGPVLMTGFSSGAFAVDYVGNDVWLRVTDATVGAVPEPGTYALLLSGLAVVGALVRRRRA